MLINKNATILDLKKYLTNALNVNKNCIKLYVNGKFTESDEKSLDSLGIKNQEIISLIFKPLTEIYL